MGILHVWLISRAKSYHFSKKPCLLVPDDDEENRIKTVEEKEKKKRIKRSNKEEENKIRYDMIKACDAGNFSADGQPIQVRK